MEQDKPSRGRARIQRVEREAKAATNNSQPAMSKVDPLLEERLNLAGQDIDQLLCELEGKLATIRSHRRRLLVDNDKPVDDEQIERGITTPTSS